jgi:hypothetical protein
MFRATELLEEVLTSMEAHGINLTRVIEVYINYHCDGDTTRPVVTVKLAPESK